MTVTGVTPSFRLNPFHKQNTYISLNMISFFLAFFFFCHIHPAMDQNICQCHLIIPDHKIRMASAAVGMSWSTAMPGCCRCLTPVSGCCHLPSQAEFLSPHSPCWLPPFPPRSHSPSLFLMFPQISSLVHSSTQGLSIPITAGLCSPRLTHSAHTARTH